MIKIGEGYFREDQIDGISAEVLHPCRVKNGYYVFLKSGCCAHIIAEPDDVERAIEALGGTSKEDGCSYVLTPGEIAELGNMQRTGATHIARDADGKVYAYCKKPYRDGAYWTTDSPFFRLKGDYFDLITSTDEPIEIKNILEAN